MRVFCLLCSITLLKLFMYSRDCVWMSVLWAKSLVASSKAICLVMLAPEVKFNCRWFGVVITMLESRFIFILIASCSSGETFFTTSEY